MKIGIVGGGAIGLLFAGWLGQTFDVTLWVRRKSQVENLSLKGVTIHRGNSSFTTKIHSELVMESPLECDLMIVAVKEYDLKPLESMLELLDPQIPLIFLQNGIGHLEWCRSLPHHNVFAGSVEHGALKENDHTLHHIGEGKTNLAIIKGEWGLVETLFSLSIPAFPFSFKQDFEEMLLTKLFANVLINPLTAIARVPNGRLVENPHFHQIQRELFQELLLLFPRMKGVISFEGVERICMNTYQNRSSMLKDVESGKKTELESILGILLAKADKDHHFVPIMKVIYRLVKGIEREGMGG
ncbi:2-dehydropantoate 2-reductase [Rossellomorea sp. AcN35-11]|nr:2-dehydropantoate 2-reductase [Rossellomorea aquimaris]WJV29003.1 2-dehydropantoate 2-reductase [Rossellomorea sp. AcN35-11]